MPKTSDRGTIGKESSTEKQSPMEKLQAQYGLSDELFYAYKLETFRRRGGSIDEEPRLTFLEELEEVIKEYHPEG